MISSLSKKRNEEEMTVRKNNNGKYFDLSKEIVRGKEGRLDDQQLMGLLAKLRLRLSLTPKCNAWCIFCSNEGSSYSAKCEGHADIDQIIKMSDMLIKNTPLRSIDFSGGEPTIHPDICSENSKLFKWTKKHPDTRFSLHTNGINLKPHIVDQIKDNFSRIGISVNSLKFETWNKITNLNNTFPIDIQKNKFKSLEDNLEYLARQNIGEKIFLKSVVMKGINDSDEELKLILDACEKYGFHPKFLEFEPQFPEQIKYIVGRKELFEKLERLGCIFSDDAPRHNDPNTYIPGVNFKYKKLGGLHSIFGCGLKAACESCFDFLCMFVKPTTDGKGLYLKPCSVLETQFDLTHAIETGNKEELINLFKMSREYLMLAPGLGTCGWNKEEKYKYE